MWKPFHKAIHRAASGLQLHAQEMAKESLTSTSFNIIGAVRVIPWQSLWHEPVRAGWAQCAQVVMRSSCMEEMRTIRSRVKVSKADAAEEDYPLVMAEELSIQWIKSNAGADIAQNLTAQNQRALVAVLDEGIRKGWSIQNIAKRIQSVIGLGPRYAAALANREEKLTKAGVSESIIAANLTRYRSKLLKLRAETVARTETVAAMNEGRLQAWRSLQSSGDLPTSAKMEWITAPSGCCDECEDMAKKAGIPLSQPFMSTANVTLERPPAHPRCRCTLGLV